MLPWRVKVREGEGNHAPEASDGDCYFCQLSMVTDIRMRYIYTEEACKHGIIGHVGGENVR